MAVNQLRFRCVLSSQRESREAIMTHCARSKTNDCLSEATSMREIKRPVTTPVRSFTFWLLEGVELGELFNSP